MVLWIHGGELNHFGTEGKGEVLIMKDNPDGKLKKEKMMEMYGAVLPTEKAKVFVDQIFQKFDSDNSGTIDFKVKLNLLFNSAIFPF